MQPERHTSVNGHKIEEYYWNGKMAIYLDNNLFAGTYGYAIKMAEKLNVAHHEST